MTFACTGKSAARTCYALAPPTARRQQGDGGGQVRGCGGVARWAINSRCPRGASRRGGFRGGAARRRARVARAELTQTRPCDAREMAQSKSWRRSARRGAQSGRRRRSPEPDCGGSRESARLDWRATCLRAPRRRRAAPTWSRRAAAKTWLRVCPCRGRCTFGARSLRAARRGLEAAPKAARRRRRPVARVGGSGASSSSAPIRRPREHNCRRRRRDCNAPLKSEFSCRLEAEGPSAAAAAAAKESNLSRRRESEISS